jgi:hypothetical protein
MAVVAFYSLIPQIFFAATPDTPYSPCAENEASDCRDMPCDARLSGLMGILLDHLSERSANPRAGEQSDFFRQWDASYRSLAPLCENENLSSYEALARLRYRVETDLVQLRERYLPILEHLPPRPIMRTADAAHQN